MTTEEWVERYKIRVLNQKIEQLEAEAKRRDGVEDELRREIEDIKVALERHRHGFHGTTIYSY